MRSTYREVLGLGMTLAVEASLAGERCLWAATVPLTDRLVASPVLPMQDISAVRVHRTHRQGPAATISESRAYLAQLAALPRATRISPYDAVVRSVYGASRFAGAARRAVGIDALRSDLPAQRDLSWGAQAVWSEGNDTKAVSRMAAWYYGLGAKNNAQ